MTELETIQGIIKPYDQILFYTKSGIDWNPLNWWGDATNAATQVGIQRYQNCYFGPKADYWTVHVEIYFDPLHIYRAVPPTLCWEALADIVNRNEKIQIVRPSFYTFDDADAQFMIQEFEKPIVYIEEGETKAMSIIGSPYDIDLCVQLGIKGLMGEPDGPQYNTDTSGDGKICSVGCALALAHYYNEYLKTHGTAPYLEIFSQIYPQYFKGAQWGDEIVKEFATNKIVPLQDIVPAHFANPHFGPAFTSVYKNF